MKLQQVKTHLPKLRMSEDAQEIFQQLFFVLAVGAVSITLAVALCMLIGWPGLPIVLFALFGYLAYGPLKE